jgi:hypothetical protein
MIARFDRALRLGVVAHALTALAALWFVARSGGETMLGPARTDDLPYGDLLTLNRSGALVWLAVAMIGLGGLVLGLRPVRLVTGGMWLLLSVVGMAVVIDHGDLFGMTRPGDVALTLGLAATAVVTGLQPDPAPAPTPIATRPESRTRSRSTTESEDAGDD